MALLHVRNGKRDDMLKERSGALRLQVGDRIIDGGLLRLRNLYPVRAEQEFHYSPPKERDNLIN